MTINTITGWFSEEFPELEYQTLIQLGIDGFFTHFPDTGFKAVLSTFKTSIKN